MANEIRFSWVAGQTNVKADVFQPDGSVREINIALVENATGRLYLGDCATIAPGDVIVYHQNGVYLSSSIYSVEPDFSIHTWQVAKTGLDTNRGHSFSTAKLTIQAAVDAASSGDTITIWPGDYDENVVLTGKALTLRGTHRAKSRIKAATGKGIVLDDDCCLYDLGVEALQVASLNYAVDAGGEKRCVLGNCDIYGSFDGLFAYGAEDLQVRNCTIWGKYDAVNVAGSAMRRFVFENCLLKNDGTYGTNVPSRSAIAAGNGTFNNCVFDSTRSDDSSSNLEGLQIGGTSSEIAVNNCSFYVKGSGDFTGSTYGIYLACSNGGCAVHNCSIYTVSAGSATVYDLRRVAGKLAISGSVYATSTGTITNPTAVLASDGLDNISTTEPAGVASNFREMLVQTWRRFFKKSTATKAAVITYKDDASAATTQVASFDGKTKTVENAS